MGDRVYRKREGGTFYGTIYERSGKRRQVCLWVRDRRAALAELRRLEREAHGAPADAAEEAPPRPLTEVLEQFLAYGLPERSEATREIHGYKAGHLGRILGEHDVNALTRIDFAKYLQQREAEGVVQHTRAKEAITMRMALRFAFENGLMARDPAGIVPKMKTGYVPRTRHLSPDEAERYVRSFKPARQAWILVGIYSGCRKSEINRIRWEHIDLENRILLAPGKKTPDAWRRLPLHPVLEALARELPRDRPTFVRPWPSPNSQLLIKARRLGIPRISPNDLRRTFASWLVQGGAPLKLVADLLGHRTTAMVEKVYGHLRAEHYRQAVDSLPSPAVREVGRR